MSGLADTMRLLVTNDDGVRAPGLIVLAQALVKEGHDVFVAGPLNDMSGSGAGFGPAYAPEGVVLEEVELAELPGVPVFALDAPPGLAVLAGYLETFGPKPDLVVSGINPGCNTGRAVLHSGTVGAALSGANFGISGIAVSADSGDPWHPETAAAFAVAAVEWVAAATRPTVLNLNVPNLPIGDVRGVREAPLAPFGTVRTVVKARKTDRVEFELRPNEDELAPETDTMTVKAGYVAVTSLVGPRPVPAVDAPEILEQAVLAGR
jgi:5'-nucleotidase